MHHNRSNFSKTPPNKKLLIKKVHPDAIVPTKLTQGAAGYDLCSYHDIHLDPGCVALADTGIAMQLPIGTYGRLAPHNGLTMTKKEPESPINLDVRGGVIDPDYRGSVKKLFCITMVQTK